MLAARAGHSRTEEDVDDKHHKEKDAEGDAEVEEPNRGDAAIITYSGHLHW